MRGAGRRRFGANHNALARNNRHAPGADLRRKRGEKEPALFEPAIESYIEGDRMVVRADLPGINSRNVEIAVTGDMLTIKGSRENKREERERNFVSTPRESVLRLYKFLNQCGYTVVGIDAAIEREAKRRKAAPAETTTRTTRQGIHRP